MANKKISVVGLGYVGLPLTLALGAVSTQVFGYDANTNKVEMLKRGEDPIREQLSGQIQSSKVYFTSSVRELNGSEFFILCVPTPVDGNRKPDLTPLRLACEAIAPYLARGSVVVVESTVYPGVTEEFCVPILEKGSGLVRGKDFFMGYSPERMNPGDISRGLKDIVKVVSGEDFETLDRVAQLYETIVSAGVYRAASIRVAEAAKVIENTQRDLNIALMNELAIIFDKLGINTQEVLAAARTKWNFLPFVPGLVGGHCIGVDPYYLTSKAESLGYHPEIILAGRRINDDMGKWVGQKLIKLLIREGIQPKGARIGVLGLTFKENVADIRNSRVVDVIRELQEFGAEVMPFDPLVSDEEVHNEYGIRQVHLSQLEMLDAVVFAVPHQQFDDQRIISMIRPGGVLVDVKGTLKDRASSVSSIVYWSL